MTGLRKKIKQNNAFTLVEMLAVVAILVIVLAISILAYGNLTKSMKITELDSYARTIYLEAQNMLAAKEVEGGMLDFYGDVLEAGVHYINAAPKDYPLSDNTWEQLCYITNSDPSDSILNQLIPSGSGVHQLPGNYLIEFNPQTGDIYGVFYWEKDNETFADYQDISKYERDSDTRSAVSIGYYGGSIVVEDERLSSLFELDQGVEVINKEELYLKISFKNTEILRTYYRTGLSIQCKVYDESGETGYVWTPKIDLSAGQNVVIHNKRIEVYVLLDGVQEHFKQLSTDAMGNSLTPGDNLSVEVESVFDQGAYYCVENSGVLSCGNSLFARKETKGGKTTIYISKIRHLMNLDALYYNGTADTKDYEIVFSDHLDMDDAKCVWNGSRYLGTEDAQGIGSLRPISNYALFFNKKGTTTVSGNGKRLSDFVVRGSGDNAGLFSQGSGVIFKDLSLLDLTVKAENSQNVGGLIGRLEGGRLENCGIYMTTYDNSGVGKIYYSEIPSVTHGNRMMERYNLRGIYGSENVGGLIGFATGTVIEKSYAAEKVSGTRNAGGFIGFAQAVTVTDSYASGNVIGSVANVGGFIGFADGVAVTNAYTTGDVYGADLVGGFLGYSANGVYANCMVYGEILTIDGTTNFDKNNDGYFRPEEGDVRAGGLLSATGNANNQSVGDSCFYMTQSVYNNHGEFDGLTDLARGYGTLTTEEGLSAVESFPYEGTLLYKAFPFEPVLEHHYGDWSLQYLVTTSLVYYERYADETYGYYCVTTLTTDDGERADDYVWVLDTLQKRECVEDGYALLSRYYLERFDYQLQIGSDESGSIDETITIESTQGSNRAVLLRQHGFLEFNAYTPIKSATEADYSADYSGRPVKDIFTIGGMYLYQLPYELQSADRYNVSNFYDKLVIYNALEKVKEGDEPLPVIGGDTLEEGVSFFYCPHFAKTAVNPGTTGASAVTLRNPATVAIRSARQLNALGRYPYYWNDAGGMTTEIRYEQEVDINFSTYTKVYCGQERNLLAFDQPYSNQPIGQWDGDPNGYGAFKNDYNGNYKKIIDYCVKSDCQYVGLFGEIYKGDLSQVTNRGNYHQIQNVVMAVSETNRGNTGNYLTESDPMKQNNAGLVIGRFQEHNTSTKGDDRARTGVGALVGSDYTIGVGGEETAAKKKIYTIYNCAASGYQVQYHLHDTNGTQQPLGIAVGGLIGYSRGNVSNSTAVNDVKLVAGTNYTGNNAAVFLGGFAGSYYHGTARYCYAGGTIDVDDASGSHYVTRLRIGGFCPGWLYAPGISNTGSTELVRYENVYSYAKVSDRVWNVREEAGGAYFTQVIPTVSRMRVSYEENVWTGFLKWEDKWTTEADNGSTTGVRVPGYSFYLNSIYDDAFMKHIDSTTKEYFTDSGSKRPKTCDGASFAQLSSADWILEKSKSNGANVNIEIHFAEGYPFPAVVKDAAGNYIHYGDGPTE